ncbi:MAG: 2,3-bisphosphoglycerate-independent phosphoglycerate mutase [Spirochaetales bacterium]|nr:2,3-bisphosphoglycerate-independent phosphoglycerate mutase [Spirochaetales bacterium]
MIEPLKKNSKMKKRRGPVLLVIMDGVGYGKYEQGDAFKAALTANLDKLQADCPTVKLKAHGKAVGLPSDDDMGNSEVGHNAIGCGRVFDQGSKLVSESIRSGNMFSGETWTKLTTNCKSADSTLHFIGLLSDGNVHSHLDHLKAMVIKAKEDGVKNVRVHALLDGRDVGETSALDYFDPFETFCKDLSSDGFSARIASGGGRMAITMDRYGANWDMVRRGWETHILGEGRTFSSPHEAIETLRAETGAIDQDLPAFVIAEDDKPVGTIEDGDSVILFNFRGDRALELTRAFEDGDDFTEFDRKRNPKVEYAGMMQYDGDLHIPKQYLVTPPAIDRTMGEFLASSGVKSFAISETQKFGHVTYFFNGNKLGKFDDELETFEEILSDVVPFEQRPWMKCADITDRVLDVIKGGEYDFIRLNFPNGDMVGHTGVFQAVVCSIEGMDLCIGRLKKAVEEAGGVMIISADHGNSDDMYEHEKKDGAVKSHPDGSPKAKTAHSLNPVPCIIFDPEGRGEYKAELKEGLGISSLAATTLEFLGFEAPEDYDPSVLDY